MNLEKDWYKLISHTPTGYSIMMKAYESFEMDLESRANEQGYSYKYTIINGHIYRRSLFKKEDKYVRL